MPIVIYRIFGYGSTLDDPNIGWTHGESNSQQELHYGDTAMAFAALTGCTEVQHYGTHLGNTKALTKAGKSEANLFEGKGKKR